MGGMGVSDMLMGGEGTPHRERMSQRIGDAADVWVGLKTGAQLCDRGMIEGGWRPVGW